MARNAKAQLSKLLSWAGQFVAPAAIAFLFHETSDRRQIEGILVLLPQEGDGSVMAGAERTIALLQQYAPATLSHASEDIRGLWVRQDGRTQYHTMSRYISISAKALGESEPHTNAAALVFSMSQARVHRRLGLIHYDQPFRTLRIAFERQVAFVRRVPNALPLLENLTRAWDSGFYLPRQQVAAAAEDLREIGVSDRLVEWFLRVALWWRT